MFRSLMSDYTALQIKRWTTLGVTLAIGVGVAAPALAHHPFGGTLPATPLQGLMSGLGHPVIGLDHLAFVVAVGLAAAIAVRGLLVPLGFVCAALAGTLVHLAGVDLPLAEVVISGSVLAVGGMLAAPWRPGTWLWAAIAAGAGLFHGYAYGEAIVGAEMTPTLAYLLGFTLMQGAIAAGAYGVGRCLNHGQGLRFAGFALAGIRVALLASGVG